VRIDQPRPLKRIEQVSPLPRQDLEPSPLERLDLRDLAQHRESRILEGASDARSCAHVDLDPAQVRGVTGDRVPQGQKRNPFGPSVRWAQAQFRGPALLGTGYFVSTVGRDEATVRDYIRRQEEEDKRLDELDLWY
jgi:REP element-mobilizing transposase RayT